MPSTYDYANYWDNKVEYFKKNEGWNTGRADIPKGDVITELIELLEIQPGELILDVGCGYGRLFSLYIQRKTKIYGIDVSPRMIEEARKIFGEYENIELRVMNAESLDFRDNMFDKIICYGTFDGLLCQNEALEEMSRVLKPGKLLLLSGKHKPYHQDDDEAKIAEKKASEVNHPNCFTNWDVFKNDLKKNGLTIKHNLFYERRNDMAVNKYQTDILNAFYEFVVVLEKK